MRLRSLFFIGVGLLAAALLVIVSPVIALLALAAPLFGLRRYHMSETAWAQIQAVGFSLQIGGTIWGLAPESWWSNRGLERRSLWPSCLAVKLFAADYNCGTRTAFGVNLGSIRFALRSAGIHGLVSDPSDAGWSFWHRPLRC